MAATTTRPLFLGLDLSTQQLKGVIIGQDSEIVHESAVHFDNDLPSYGTKNGAIKGPGEGEVTSPVTMWLDAVDLLMERLKAAGVSFSDIVAISGAGQQHGSVYWSAEAERLLANLDASRSLKSQLSGAFSLPRAPIWQDSSTSKECQELEAAVGGAQALADLTGSRAYERFTGSQIAKIRHRYPKEYASTLRISLVSSFVASLFLGQFAPIEVSDGSGMNLMNVLTGRWDDKLLETCGGSALRSKLGPEPVLGGANLGKLSIWWTMRWGFNPECIVAPFTGDNPATVVALSGPGDALLSLGTSTTFLLSIPPAKSAPKRTTTSHLLTHPITLDAQLAMLCYKNGALTREYIRDEHASRHWHIFNELVLETPPGNNGRFGLYFTLPEIIPPNVIGNHFFETGPDGLPVRVDNLPENAHARAVLESQLLSILSRIEGILPESSLPLHRVLISGGGSANDVIRQLIADVFGIDVYISSTKEAAALGGALLAKYAWLLVDNPNTSFEEMVGGHLAGTTRVATPRADIHDLYEKLVHVYEQCEEIVIRS
ncbi:D-xylulose kinase [Pluteus cervinus]|uniref:D-xylulose kinase n=1 Tax=Pluteus cervinus TaxID=181527 RepID=A0ACD3BBP3_9AGAR|nr:D-xylulose kinase [Pluteus cervinus]